jgi:hypothetical protein
MTIWPRLRLWPDASDIATGPPRWPPSESEARVGRPGSQPRTTWPASLTGCRCCPRPLRRARRQSGRPPRARPDPDLPARNTDRRRKAQLAVESHGLSGRPPRWSVVFPSSLDEDRVLPGVAVRSGQREVHDEMVGAVEGDRRRPQAARDREPPITGSAACTVRGISGNCWMVGSRNRPAAGITRIVCPLNVPSGFSAGPCLCRRHTAEARCKASRCSLRRPGSPTSARIRLGHAAA